MIKKSLKYLIVAIANVIVLTILLAIWTDKLELTFNEWVRPREFLKIIGFAVASLISMRVLVNYFRHRNIAKTSSKLKAAALLTFLVSSYLYIDYSVKVVSNVVINRQFRNQIADKIEHSNLLANGNKAEGLTIKEYQQITKIYWFPKLPDEASNIKYTYDYDGFLPDYLFTLTYDLPAQMNVEIINIKNGDFSKSQSFVTIGTIKRITYNESEQ